MKATFTTKGGSKPQQDYKINNEEIPPRQIRHLDMWRVQALGGVGWRVKGLWIWTGMHFLWRKLTFFEGSCIWPKALGGGWAGGSKVSGFGQVCIFWGEN